MSFYTMADNNVPITANRDGALYNVALANTNFIVKGLGEEFAPSVTGLQFSVGTGIAVIHGRHVTSQLVTSDNTIELPPNTSGYVVMRFDLARPVGSEAYLFATPTLTQEEINWNGVVYDMPIATFTSTLTNASIEDVRNVTDKASGLEYTEVEPIATTPLDWVDFIYPIGSVYFSVDNVDPSQKFMGTSWELIGEKLAVRENVFGNGIALGFNNNKALCGAGDTIDMNINAPIGTPVGRGNYRVDYWGRDNGVTYGVATKTQLGANPQYSGLIVDTEAIYSWKRVA